MHLDELFSIPPSVSVRQGSRRDALRPPRVPGASPPPPPNFLSRRRWMRARVFATAIAVEGSVDWSREGTAAVVRFISMCCGPHKPSARFVSCCCCSFVACLFGSTQIGLGIHGEAGIKQTGLQTADALTDVMISAVVDPEGKGNVPSRYCGGAI